MKSVYLLIFILLTFLATPSCTTANYKNKIQSTEIPDHYKFKVFVGGFQIAPPLNAAKVKIHEFMMSEGYTKYEITKQKYIPIPSSYEFSVKFTK